MAHETNTETRIPIAPHQRAYIIWTVMFGAALGGGGSILSGTLPPEPVTRALVLGWFVALMLVMNKLVLLRPFSVTHMLAVASFVGIFTFYLGPPNPYKPLFILAGLAFDLGTLFRTKTIAFWNLVLGYVLYTGAGVAVFLLTLHLIDPSIVTPVADLMVYAVAIFWAIAFPCAYLVWRYLRPGKIPERLLRIQRAVSPD